MSVSVLSDLGFRRTGRAATLLRRAGGRLERGALLDLVGRPRGAPTLLRRRVWVLCYLPVGFVLVAGAPGSPSRLLGLCTHAVDSLHAVIISASLHAVLMSTLQYQ